MASANVPEEDWIDLFSKGIGRLAVQQMISERMAFSGYWIGRSSVKKLEYLSKGI